MSSTISVDIEPQTKCACGHPLSNVNIAVDGDATPEFVIPEALMVLVMCPRCSTTQPVPVEPEHWEQDVNEPST